MIFADRMEQGSCWLAQLREKLFSNCRLRRINADFFYLVLEVWLVGTLVSASHKRVQAMLSPFN